MSLSFYQIGCGPKPVVWFNKTIEAFPDAISVEVHDVPDGDHTDL